jgi:hypothetical protein
VHPSDKTLGDKKFLYEVGISRITYLPKQRVTRTTQTKRVEVVGKRKILPLSSWGAAAA